MPSPKSLKLTRRRRRAGFTLLMVGVALTLLVGVSVKWWFGYGTPTWIVDVGDGTLYVTTMTPNEWSRPLIGWSGGVNESRDSSIAQSWSWTWWAWGDRKNSWEGGKAYSIWPLAPILLVAGLVLFRPSHQLVKRARNNQCLGCGYSRTGLTPQTACPECGMGPNDPGNSRRE